MLWARRGLSWKQKHFTLYPSSASEAAAEAPARPVPTTSTSNFRLLAGLTSLMSNLWLSHFAASGPEGALLSRIIRKNLISFERFLSVAEENRHWNGGIAQKNHQREPARGLIQKRAIGLVVPAERLKHAAGSMTQVQAQQRHSQNIKRGYPAVVKADYHHLKNIMP